MKSYKEILPLIRTFVFDVDGILTNGSVLLSNGDMLRTMNSKDAYILQYAAKLGYGIFAITGGDSMEVKIRLEKLGVKEVILHAKNKVESYQELAKKYNLNLDELLYMGDDIPDMDLLNLAKVSVCPNDAAIDVRNIVDYVSPLKGGEGCVRDIMEQTLRVQSKWLLPEAKEW